MLSNDQLAAYHGYSERSIRYHFHRARCLLSTWLTPRYLGFGHLTTVNPMVQHRNPYQSLIEILFKAGRRVGYFVDGQLQAQHGSVVFKHSYDSYSMQKGYNARLFQGVCLGDGYLVDFLGGYCSSGSHNDAKVWHAIVDQDVNNLRLHHPCERYVYVFDRGYAEYLDTGFPGLFVMPSVSKKKPTPCLDANISRLVTRIRFVIEKVFGHVVNENALFQRRIIAQHKPYIDTWMRSSLAIHNLLRPWHFEPRACQGRRRQHRPAASAAHHRMGKIQHAPFFCVQSSERGGP